MNRSRVRYFIMLMMLVAVKLLLGAGGGSDVWTYEIIVGYEWRYTLYDDKATLVAAPQTIDGRLVVPERFGMYPVVSIAPSAFAGRDDIKELHLPEGVEEIGYNAFRNCANLTELTIPDTVQTMGEGVFAGCTSLEKLTIPFVGESRDSYESDASVLGYIFGKSPSDGSMYVYQKYKYTYPKETHTISHSACYMPTNLSTIVVTDATSIGFGAFSGLEYLKTVQISGRASEVGQYAFYGCTRLESVSLANGVTTIGAHAFEGCINISTEAIASFPRSVKYIGDYAFMGCTKGLAEICLWDGVETIGPFAFSNCSGATNVHVSASVTNIETHAFLNCIGIESLTIPETVLTIEYGAFGCCTGLKKLTVPFVGKQRGGTDGEQSVLGWVFGSQYRRDGTEYIRQLCRYVFPSFSTCGCYMPTELEEVVVTDETTVGFGAFSECSHIKEITFHGMVESMGGYLFNGASNLGAVRFFCNAPSIADSSFYGRPASLVLKVARGSTGWGVDISGTWNGVRIEYIDAGAELPDVETDDEARATVAEFADVRIAECITTKAEYDAFREWARTLKGTGDSASMTEAVKASGTAWLSFALDADTLVEKELTDEDITIESFSVGAGGGAMEAQAPLSLEFAVDGVAVGAAAVGERMNTVLGVEGAEELKESAFSSDNVAVSLSPTGDGRVRATVIRRGEGGTARASPDSFFLRVKVK